jgi:hypothetical protein
MEAGEVRVSVELITVRAGMTGRIVMTGFATEVRNTGAEVVAFPLPTEMVTPEPG